jgi:RNA polymerase sigma-70 factor (ECF subfamily)
MDQPTDDDSSLLAGLRSREEAAFERVYARHRVALFGFLVRLAGDRALAADLFQNTWFKLARTAHRLRPDTDLGAWLFTVARNEYRSYRRWHCLDLTRLVAFHGQQQAAVDEGGELGLLEKALASLPDADRELLLLVGVAGFEPRKAAEVLRISHAALRQRLGRARKRLRETLEELDR